MTIIIDTPNNKRTTKKHLTDTDYSTNFKYWIQKDR